MTEIHINKIVIYSFFWEFYRVDAYFQGDLLFIIFGIQNTVWNSSLVCSTLNWSAFDEYGKQGSTPWFGFLFFKYSCVIDLQTVLFSVTEGKVKAKNIFKGKMKAQAAAALIILTRDVRMLK